MVDFNQRVYLRRDPSQFGRIGVTGQSFDPGADTQAVFWEHTGGDVVTVEPVNSLMGEEEKQSIEVMERLYDAVQAKLDEEEERQECRRLFFRAMRHPDMRVLRGALRSMSIDAGVDWHAIQSIEMEQYGAFNDCWILKTDHYLVTTSWADKPRLGLYDFSTYRLHDENDPCCECDVCRESRICHVDLKASYIPDA